MGATINPLYRVIFGHFVVKNSSPDGDGVRFRPNDPTLLQFVGGFDATDSDDRAMNVRCEGIDAPELHYRPGNTGPYFQQPRGVTARNALLSILGFNAPIPSAADPLFLDNPEQIPGVVFTRRGTGGMTGGASRAVGYLLTKKTAGNIPNLQDGSEIPLDDALLKRTASYLMLERGEAYAAVVDDLPLNHRAVFHGVVKQAQQAGIGVWAQDQDTSGEFRLESLSSIDQNGKLIYPSLFRKCVDYLAAVGTPDSTDLITWMTQARDEDDGLMLDGATPTTLTKVVTHSLANKTVKLAVSRDRFVNAVFELRPIHRVPLDDPKAWAGLARGEAPWIFTPTEPKKIDLLRKISTCRFGECKVPEKHPYFRGELLQKDGSVAPAAVACLPVVPVHVNPRKIMVMGWYPAANFASRAVDGRPVSAGSNVDNEMFVPNGNIARPWPEDVYFDGYKVREILSSATFHRDYVTRLGLNLKQHAWVTNLIKCYMFKKSNVTAYTKLGWHNDPVMQGVPLAPTFETDMFGIADACVKFILDEEVDLCAPQLIITLGDAPCSVMHDLQTATDERRKQVFKGLQGAILPAGEVAPKEAELGAKRSPLWSKYNVVHLLHPEDYLQSSRASTSPQLDHPATINGKDTVKRVNEQLESVQQYIAAKKILV